MLILKPMLLCAIIALTLNSNAQVATPSTPKYYWSVKDFSKEIALYRAKSFVVNTILKNQDDVVQFEMDPLAAASSGELTSLVYKSVKLSKEGLILGFFGDKWNASGVVYQAYAFKSFPTVKAIDLLNKIEAILKDNSKYLNADAGSINVSFKYDDMTFIISTEATTNIRVFWDDFDASWDSTAFKRTKKRLLKKID